MSKFEAMQNDSLSGFGPVHTDQPISASQGLAPPYIGNTTVIVTQPGFSTGRLWSSGMCDCCADCGICLAGYFCGICQACAIAKKLEENGCAAMCHAGQVALRTKYRLKHQIQGSILNDVCVTLSVRAVSDGQRHEAGNVPQNLLQCLLALYC